jgi:hypothetical protein
MEKRNKKKSKLETIAIFYFGAVMSLTNAGALIYSVNRLSNAGANNSILESLFWAYLGLWLVFELAKNLRSYNES